MSYVRTLTTTLCIGVVALLGLSLSGSVHAQGEKPPVVDPPKIKVEAKPETKVDAKVEPKDDPKVEVKQAGKDAPDEKKEPTVSELKAEFDKATGDAATAANNLKVGADTVWVMITGMLVFFMNLGFACVESGFCRAKNCVNILSKNFIVFAATTIGFWALGWGIMFGNNADSLWYAKDGIVAVSGGTGKDNSPVTASFKSALKDDLKADGVDLSDEAVAKKYPKVVAAVDDYSTKFLALTSNTVTKTVDGKDEQVDAEFPVTIKIDDSKTFEKTYTVKNYYWGPYSGIAWAGVPLWAKFFFQLVFAGTAATIVSGAVAERIKYHSFIIFSFVMAICIYPVVGHWIWGGGYLGDMGFLDFAGSTQVHSIGGWAALIAVIILGPRIGKYGPGGKVNAIPGHNMTAATIGCLILWFGWFGFNPGSTMGVGDGASIAHVAITTNLAACAATLTATITAWLIMGKPDIGMTLNGCLAGLVAITAPCAFVSPASSLIIGAIAGVLVVLAVMGFDKIGIDDPVGATSVHLVNGVFGTICVGLFAETTLTSALTLNKGGLLVTGSSDLLKVQLIGIGLTAVYVCVVSAVAWTIIKLVVGMRVSAQEEVEGLDIGEHGNEAYHGFQMISPEILAGGSEPKPATVPADAKKRFTVVVEGIPADKIAAAWGDLCKPAKDVSKDFMAIYPKMTILQGTKFKFIDGNPDTVSGQLAKVLQAKTGTAVKTFVEK